jgi:hypothetical protein
MGMGSQAPAGPGKGGRRPAPPRGFPGGPGKGVAGPRYDGSGANPYGQLWQPQGRPPYGGGFGQAQQAQQLQQQLAGQQQALGAGLGGVGMYGGMQNGAEAAPARSYETYPDAAQQAPAPVIPQRWTPEQKAAWGQQQQAAAPVIPQRWTPEEKTAWGQQQQGIAGLSSAVPQKWTPEQKAAWGQQQQAAPVIPQKWTPEEKTAWAQQQAAVPPPPPPPPPPPSATPQKWTPEEKESWARQQQQAAAPVPQRWTPEEKASWAQQQAVPPPMSYPELTSQQMGEAGLSRQEQNRVGRGIIAPDIQGKISDWQTGRWTPEQIAAWEASQRAGGGIVSLYWPGGRVY